MLVDYSRPVSALKTSRREHELKFIGRRLTNISAARGPPQSTMELVSSVVVCYCNGVIVMVLL